MILASNLGDLAMAELIGTGFVAAFLIATISLVVAIPKSLRKYARWVSRCAIFVTGAFFLFAFIQAASTRPLRFEDAQHFALLLGPTIVSVYSLFLTRESPALTQRSSRQS
jgi:hypothetical protein